MAPLSYFSAKQGITFFGIEAVVIYAGLGGACVALFVVGYRGLMQARA